METELIITGVALAIVAGLFFGIKAFVRMSREHKARQQKQFIR